MPNKNSSQIATNSKRWADCPEHGNDKFPSGSCHECAMLQPPPAEDTATKAVVALGRIASGKHENGEPLSADQHQLRPRVYGRVWSLTMSNSYSPLTGQLLPEITRIVKSIDSLRE